MPAEAVETISNICHHQLSVEIVPAEAVETN